MTHLVDVSQLGSITNDGAFLNVDAGYGYVLVWTSTYCSLTFLLRNRKSQTVRLVSFDNLDWAFEWLIANCQRFDELEVL